MKNDHFSYKTKPIATGQPFQGTTIKFDILIYITYPIHLLATKFKAYKGHCNLNMKFYHFYNPRKKKLKFISAKFTKHVLIVPEFHHYAN